jgi:hypothetical protein
VNDDCTGAIELMTGVPMSVSMEGAFPGDESDCIINTDDFNGISTPGLWYYVDGLGSALEISTCDPVSGNGTFSGRIQVFRGSSCSSTLVCQPVIFGDCFSHFSASVKFLAEEGEMYYVLFLSSWVWGEANAEDNRFTVAATYFDAAVNDVCEGAFPVDRESLFINGSTENSLPDLDPCEGYSSSGGGVWYTVQGTGKPMMVSTCSTAELSLRVFSGSCNQLVCVARGSGGYNTDFPKCNNPSPFSGIVIQTNVDTTYRILVASVFDPVVEFGLTISDVETPRNDLCGSAIRIVPDTGTVDVNAWNATSIGSFYNTSSSNETYCALDWNSPGVWYSLKGTGRGYAISTCHNGTRFSAVSISSGSCHRMKCITIAAYNDYSCWGRGASRAIIRTEMDIDYFIFVHSGESYYREGNFGLTVTSFDLVPNDLCLDALAIVPDNATIFGSTVEATYSGPSGCPITIKDYDMGNPVNPLLTWQSPDLWYRVEGTGSKLLVVPSGYAEFEPQVEILEGWNGTCTTLQCVTASDAMWWYGDTVEWFATLGKTYFIRVFGRAYSVGQFQLSLKTGISNITDLVSNDRCMNALTIVPDNTTIFGSTVEATYSGTLGCSEVYGMEGNPLLAWYQKPDIWYRVDGTGSQLAVFPSGYRNFDPRIEILEGGNGTCSTLLCVTSNDKQFFSGGASKMVEWFAALGKTYFIRVFGRSYISGRFQLSLRIAISNSSIG